MTQRQEIIERLNGLEMEGGSHAMLSAICKAVLPHGDAWTLRRCADLRDRLVRLLGEAEQPKERDGRITDELRHSIEGAEQLYGRKFPCLTAIADRIDAEHERALSHAYMDVSDSMWFRLPKDIDDKPIVEHAKVDWRDHAGTWHENVPVVAVCHDGCYVMDGTVFCVHKSDIRRHRDPDTWERIIRDAIMRGADMQWKFDGDSRVTDYSVPEGYDLVDRCKALAGDAE